MTSLQPWRFDRGSEWRRWDLHVHTPHSALHHEFGSDFDAYARVLFERAIEDKIAVIGVTDYFTIDGYKALRELVDDSDRLVALLGETKAAAAKAILLIPNVELRARDVIRGPDGDARVNFHLLFSEQLTPKQIEEGFIHQLHFTDLARPDGPAQRQALTVPNLEALGRRLKAEHDKFAGRSDLAVGMEQAVVDHETVTTVLDRQQHLFKDRFLFVVPCDEDLATFDWDGQAHLVRKVFLQKAHMLFASNKQTRKFALGEFHASPEAFRQEFSSLMPCIHGSDAHRFETLFKPDLKRNTWIKSNPTFDGLRQLLHEPADRVHIGEHDPTASHLGRNSTKYIDEISFLRAGGDPSDEKWFSGTLRLNPGLVAIIGKKGGGKSALADILGLAGNARTSSEFSFLTGKRFLSRKNRAAALFSAKVTWLSGQTVTRAFTAAHDPAVPETVEYIPQKHLENICSEISDASTVTKFDSELERVIFSHVDPAETLGKKTLSELLSYQTSEKEASIRGLQERMHAANSEIIGLQRQLTPDYRRQLEGQLSQRKTELAAHEAARPPKPPEPDDAAVQEKDGATRERLAEIVSRIEKFDEAIATNLADREQVNRKLAAAKRLSERLSNLDKAVQAFLAGSEADAAELGIALRSLVEFRADQPTLERLQFDLAAQLGGLSKLVDPEDPKSLPSRRSADSALADAERAKLDEPSRVREEFHRAMAGWERIRTEIMGDASDASSIAGLEELLTAIDAVPMKLAHQEAIREDLVRQIFSYKTELLGVYRTLYAPVQNFIDTHEVSKELNSLSFSASIVVDGFADSFLSMIHRGRKGAFQGDREGRQLVDSIVETFDLDTPTSACGLVNAIYAAVTTRADDRVASDLSVVESQLTQAGSAQALYDFVFGLDYLVPRFSLLWRGKQLDQLSPGERGTLLLVFFLLIDRRDVPLVIDQPEENLDNETIAELLVPAIKYAKSRRQVVIVTHNPNLAVVCDADQVIHASINKADGNAISYTSGSIEDPTVTRMIVNVLEGTKPAFDLRDAKYDVLERAT